MSESAGTKATGGSIDEIETKRKSIFAWLVEQNYSACDIPGCLHPCCRGKTVEQRKADGPVLELAQMPSMEITR